jgi:hypothetical protein
MISSNPSRVAFAFRYELKAFLSEKSVDEYDRKIALAIEDYLEENPVVYSMFTDNIRSVDRSIFVYQGEICEIVADYYESKGEDRKAKVWHQFAADRYNDPGRWYTEKNGEVQYYNDERHIYEWSVFSYCKPEYNYFSTDSLAEYYEEKKKSAKDRGVNYKNKERAKAQIDYSWWNRIISKDGEERYSNKNNQRCDLITLGKNDWNMIAEVGFPDTNSDEGVYECFVYGKDRKVYIQKFSYHMRNFGKFYEPEFIFQHVPVAEQFWADVNVIAWKRIDYPEAPVTISEDEDERDYPTQWGIWHKLGTYNTPSKGKSNRLPFFVAHESGYVDIMYWVDWMEDFVYDPDEYDFLPSKSSVAFWMEIRYPEPPIDSLF